MATAILNPNQTGPITLNEGPTTTVFQQNVGYTLTANQTAILTNMGCILVTVDGSNNPLTSLGTVVTDALTLP